MNNSRIIINSGRLIIGLLVKLDSININECPENKLAPNLKPKLIPLAR